MTEVAMANACAAILPSPFITDLALSVSNSGSDDDAARYLLGKASDVLRRGGQPYEPIAAFDFAVFDIEAIGEVWPLMRMACEIQPIAAGHMLPALARFIADRLSGIWESSPWEPKALKAWVAPVTRVVVLADRADTLAGMFAAGLKPNGSKDPYALRRAVNDFIRCCGICPVTVGAQERKAA